MRKLQILILIFLMLGMIVPGHFSGNTAAAYVEVWVDDDASPSWYGGNHVATIQEALSIVEPGGTIYVLPGDYYNGTPIVIQIPVKIVGYSYPTVRDPFEITYTENVSISGLRIQPSTTVSPSVPRWASGYFEPSAIYLRSVSNISFFNNTIGPVSEGAGIYAFTVSNVVISNNTFYNISGSAVNFEVLINGTVTKNRFISNSQSGYGAIFSYFVAKNLNITNNLFVNNSKADVYSLWAMNDGKISNNTMISSPSIGSTAITLIWSPDNVIEGNTITGYQTGIRVGNSSNVWIVSNRIYNCSEWAMHLGASGNDVVKGNEIMACGGGIYLYKMDFFSISDNVISDTESSGIKIEGTYNLSTFRISQVPYEWVNTSSLTPELTITGYSTGQVYQLPFVFPFDGRNITMIYVTTNGVIELLESGQSPLSSPTDNHMNKFYMGTVNAIFALSEYYLAFGGGYIKIYNLGDRVVVEYYVGTYPDWYRYYLLTGSAYFRITNRYMWFQVVLYKDGRIRWNLRGIRPFAHYADFWLGVYAKGSNYEGFAEEVLHQMALKSGTSYGFSGDPTGELPNSIVEDNVVENGTGDGITILNSGSLLLTGNTVNNFTGAGISVTNSTDVEILNGVITNSGVGVSAFNSSGVEVHHNAIVGNGIGVSNYPLGNETPWVNATKNWWGSSDGPSRIEGVEYSWRTPTGSGDYVTNYVYFDPWDSPELQYALQCMLSPSLTPCQHNTVRIKVTNPSDLSGEFLVVLRDRNKVIGLKRIHLYGHESKVVTFNFQFTTSGVHQLSVNGELKFNVTVGGGSAIDLSNGAQLLSLMWTLMFYSQYDEFETLYEKALSEGVDNETLQLALEKYNNATDTILAAWEFGDIDALRTAFWAKKVTKTIYLVRDAYLEMREAVGILEAALS